jgi:formate dehydrogenase assembly factor FdhD
VTRKITLSVNNTPIDLDYFVAGYLDHVTGGIIASLKGASDIRKLELNIDEDGIVTIELNGADIPLNFFTTEIVRSTVTGMVIPLKGVAGAINKLELKIER